MREDLNVRQMRISYGKSQILHGLDFDVSQGQIVTLLGPNGAGKTTTLKGIAGVIRSDGDVVYGGHNLTAMSTDQILRKGIALVPEGRGTFTSLTAEENLRLGAISRRDKSEIERDIDKMYGFFPILKQRRRQQAGTMSGGEQQMLAVARALMSRPKFLLLDEPSFGLAPRIIEQLFGILSNIQKSERLSMLIVEQNADLVLQFADRAFVLESGRIIMSGTAAELRNNDAVLKSYLGY